MPDRMTAVHRHQPRVDRLLGIPVKSLRSAAASVFRMGRRVIINGRRTQVVEGAAGSTTEVEAMIDARWIEVSTRPRVVTTVDKIAIEAAAHQRRRRTATGRRVMGRRVGVSRATGRGTTGRHRAGIVRQHRHRRLRVSGTTVGIGVIGRGDRQPTTTAIVVRYVRSMLNLVHVGDQYLTAVDRSNSGRRQTVVRADRKIDHLGVMVLGVAFASCVDNLGVIPAYMETTMSRGHRLHARMRQRLRLQHSRREYRTLIRGSLTDLFLR